MLYFEGRSQLMKSIAFNKKVVEVGVNIGQFSSLILQAQPSILYLVDAWEKQNLDNYNKDILYNTDYNNNYKLVCNRFQNIQNVKIIKAYSLDAVKMFSDAYFDIVYLDANHSKQGVYKDLVFWTPKIKSGGFMCGHDYLTEDMQSNTDLFTNGVREAVQQFLKETNRQLYALSIRTASFPDCSFVFRV